MYFLDYFKTAGFAKLPDRTEGSVMVCSKPPQ